MTTEGYREEQGDDSMESWNKGKEFPMSEAERAASWQRGIEYRNISPEQRELLKGSNLKIEYGGTVSSDQKGHSDIFKISGTADGKQLELMMTTAPDPTFGIPIKHHNYKDVGEQRVLVPESLKGIKLWEGDKVEGTLDGQPINGEEAAELWRKYAQVAAVNTADEKLVGFVDDESLKSMWREQFIAQDKDALESAAQHIKELMGIPEGEPGYMNPEVRRKNELKLEVIDEMLIKLRLQAA